MYTKNFSIAEFASKDGIDSHCRMDQDFMDRLQRLRDKFKLSMVITSGIRSPEHNKAVGGSPKSQHLTRPCIACDISIEGWNSSERHRFIQLVILFGFTGIGIGRKFIHLDMREFPAMWVY